MRTRYFALAFGLMFLAAGIIGFIPTLLSPPPSDGPPMAITAYYGYLFGLFPVNLIHNAVHIGFGLWGLSAWSSTRQSRFFARSLAVVYAVLAVFGLIPGLDTLFGMMPLQANDVWLHAGTAVAAAYFGWVPVFGAVAASRGHS